MSSLGATPDAIVGVDLVLPRGQRRRNVTIVLDGDRIGDVLDGPAPTRLRAVDGTGLTAIPGLVDAHVHWRRWAAPLFIKFGVTSVRDVGSLPADIIAERRAQQRGEFIGPRIVAHGPLLDGTRPVFSSAPDFDVPLDSVDAATSKAAALLAQGLDGLKTYASMPPELVVAVASVARSYRVPLASHLGTASARDASAAGVQSIEHASGVDTTASLTQQRAVLAELMERGTWIVPTDIALSNYARLPSIGTVDYPGLGLVPSEQRDTWLNWRSNPVFVQAASGYQRDLPGRADFMRTFIAAGGRVGVGTDTPNPFVIPGLSVHEELSRLVSLGMSPAAALDAATSGAAQLMGRRDLGVIQRGYLADVVLVRGDPIADVRAAQNVVLVVQSGRVVYPP